MLKSVMLKSVILTGLISLSQIVTYAQGNQELLKNLTPIVQVFGTAAYNFENRNYEYRFSRAHIGFQYQFNEKWSSKIILDRGMATTVGKITVTDVDGNILTVQNTSSEGAYYTMYLKFASLQWKANDRLTLEGGAVLQNHYITQERFWGLRYVAQTFQDLHWAIPSTDLGFIAYYKLNKTIAVDAALTNGEGPRVKQDNLGRVKLATGMDINPSNKIQTRFYYHNREANIDSLKTEQMVSLFAGYKPTNKFRIGGEFNYMDHLNNANGVKSYGFSVYSVCQMMKKTDLFIRYDRLLYDLNHDENITNIKGDGNTILLGIAYSPLKGINLSLNYQGWNPDDKIDNINNVLLSMEYKF